MRKVLLLALGFVFVLSGASFAFHDGGVADCSGCHTMHNSQDGAPIDATTATPNGNPYLLVDDSPSDVCIGCHDHLDRTYPIGGDPMTPPAQRAGGNFIFLDEDNINDGHNGYQNPITGDAAGHNLYAPAHGLSTDQTLTLSPGGSFPASQMGCTSCHDPHGTSDFRFLYGAGRIVQAGVATFTNPAPTAVGVSIFAPVSNTYHTAYQDGMSGWCGNCHGDFHNEANGALIHPSGSNLSASIATAYGLYNGTGELPGDPATSYLEAVPFEDAAMTNFATSGPTAASNVMCLTCHRAHASSAPDAGRWDFNITLLDEDGLGGDVDSLGNPMSASYVIPNPYEATAGANQRSLCNKCHEKDDFDTIH